MISKDDFKAALEQKLKNERQVELEALVAEKAKVDVRDKKIERCQLGLEVLHEMVGSFISGLPLNFRSGVTHISLVGAAFSARSFTIGLKDKELDFIPVKFDLLHFDCIVEFGASSISPKGRWVLGLQYPKGEQDVGTWVIRNESGTGPAENLPLTESNFLGLLQKFLLNDK